jgi:assimilatory nitrate reductase catalytic subunit
MLMPQPMAWHGLLFERAPRALAAPDYWCRVAIDGGFMYALAGARALAEPGEAPAGEQVSEWLGDFRAEDLAVYADPDRGVFRYARFEGGALAACLFVARDPAALPDRASAAAMFAEPAPAENRSRLLAGRPLSGAPDVGAIICACHAVGRTTIVDAIAARGLDTVHAIGEALKAGTNCGSCKPELAAILRETSAARSARPESAASAPIA